MTASEGARQRDENTLHERDSVGILLLVQTECASCPSDQALPVQRRSPKPRRPCPGSTRTLNDECLARYLIVQILTKRFQQSCATLCSQTMFRQAPGS